MRPDDSLPGTVPAAVPGRVPAPVPGTFPGTVPRTAPDRALLHAVRDLVRADAEMRAAMGRRMTLGATDLRALRFVMAGERAGRPATPHELAARLDISTAATTSLLDRLVGTGHVERVPHPTDRRSKVVVATPHAYDEAGRELASAHDRMRAAAAAVPASARPAVLAFLAELTDVMRSEAGPAATPPGAVAPARPGPAD